MKRRTVPCKYCQADIIFIRMPEGKALPCDPDLVPYKDGGYERMLTEDGTMVKGYLHYPVSEEPDGLAYRLHFASCTRGRERGKGSRRGNG